MTSTPDLRYPIGPFTPIIPHTPDVRRAAVDDIAMLPRRIREAIADLDDIQLDTRYRPDGWTIRQVVHHVADSHMNGFIRLKLALTEDNPTIKPYDEAAWAELADARLPLEISLAILDNLHTRWTAVYQSLENPQFERTFFHPQMQKRFTLDVHVQLYSWHSRHHVAHITSLRQRQGW
jgi:DinB superfamily